MSDQSSDVPHVSEQQYVATCEQDGCGRKSRGTLPELADAGWIMMPVEQLNLPDATRRTPAFFCPVCVLGLKPA
jgi:hypothetical protein